MSTSNDASPEGVEGDAIVTRLVAMTVNEKYSIPIETLQAWQLQCLRDRVRRVTPTIAVVRKLAFEQGVSDVETVADAAPLLLRNAVYKSYPMRAVEAGRFDQLTQWLDKLTAHDLSAVDASRCESLDEWIDLVSAETEIRIIHSSGTSGKLSFLPRSRRELKLCAEAFRHLGEGFGDEPAAGAISDFADMPYIFASYRHGATEASRVQDALVEHVYGGDESRVISLAPGRLSADALSLVGRFRKGDEAAIRATLPPQVLARFEALRAAEQDAPERMRRFVCEALAPLKGRKVVFLGSLGMFYDTALIGAQHGLAALFHPDSVIAIGGGSKGRDLPPDAMQVVERFMGVGRVRGIYGLSECIALTRDCPHGKYHVQPWIIPFLLDPNTGAQHPRSGTHRGHLGYFDLIPTTYWGGYLTGDEVTLSWGDDAPCPCGRIGPYVHSDIRRYSEQEGGDDKITCAGTPEAHNKAIEFIMNVE